MDDILSTIWGYETFQRCIPEKHKTNIAILVGKYYQNHISDSNIKKVILLSDESTTKCKDSKKIQTIKSKIHYVKDHWND